MGNSSYRNCQHDIISTFLVHLGALDLRYTEYEIKKEW